MTKFDDWKVILVVQTPRFGKVSIEICIGTRNVDFVLHSTFFFTGSVPNPQIGDEHKILPPKPVALTPSRSASVTTANSLETPTSSAKKPSPNIISKKAVSLKNQDLRPPVVRQIEFITNPKSIKVNM